MTAPKDIPGAQQQYDTGDIPSASVSASSFMNPPPSTSTSTSKTATTRSRSNTFAYPRWDANGNSHHPPPDFNVPVSSPKSVSSGGGGMSPSSSSILTLLGLSPKSANNGTIPLPSVHQGQGHGHGHGHRRGVSVGQYDTSTTSSSSSSSPFYDDDDDDDGPSEAITPPQQQQALALGLTSLSSDERKERNKQLKKQHPLKPTNFGNELGALRRQQVDDGAEAAELYDKAGPISGAGGGGISTTGDSGQPNSDIYGAPLGRRASWSPRPLNNNGNNTSTTTSSSPPSGTSILSWLHGQQYSSSNGSGNNSTNGGGPTFGNNNSRNSVGIKQPPSTQIETSTSAAAGNVPTGVNADNSYKDFGSSPVGLFRRLSLSVNRRVSSAQVLCYHTYMPCTFLIAPVG